jgi:hypothetical protein
LKKQIINDRVPFTHGDENGRSAVRPSPGGNRPRDALIPKEARFHFFL